MMPMDIRSIGINHLPGQFNSAGRLLDIDSVNVVNVNPIGLSIFHGDYDINEEKTNIKLLYAVLKKVSINY